MKGKIISFLAYKLLGKKRTLINYLPNAEERRLTMRERAIAYTSDVILGKTGEVISRNYQKELINKFAEENGLEIVAWFEDKMYEEDILARPGIKELLAYEGPYEVFLVERIWALSRKMGTLAGFFKVLEQKKVKVETATYLWDCTSQMVRRAVTTKPVAPAVVKPLVTKEDAKKAAISRPEKLNFGWAFHRQGA